MILPGEDGYAKFNDERFTLCYGSEMPKYRTGHTWWIGQTEYTRLFLRMNGHCPTKIIISNQQGTTMEF